VIPTLTLPQILALIVVAIGTVTDLRTRKIHNVLTFPASGIAIALNFYLSGPSGALMSVAGWFAGLALMACPILLLPQTDPNNRKGFGDIKLMAATGAFLGPKLALCVFFYFCIFYGLLGVGKIAVMAPWYKLVLQLIAPGKYQITPEDIQKITQMRKSYMPLGPAIFLGTICALMFEKQTLALFSLQ